jgi:hypothetical protein
MLDPEPRGLVIGGVKVNEQIRPGFYNNDDTCDFKVLWAAESNSPKTRTLLAIYSSSKNEWL